MLIEERIINELDLLLLKFPEIRARFERRFNCNENFYENHIEVTPRYMYNNDSYMKYEYEISMLLYDYYQEIVYFTTDDNISGSISLNGITSPIYDKCGERYVEC